MATGMTTPGNYQSELSLQAVDDMLSTPLFNLIHSMAAETFEAKAYNGDTSRMSRLERLSTDGGQLDGSGIDPAPEIPVRTDIDAKMEFYGKVIAVNEQVELFSSHPVQAKYKILLGQWLREKEDLLMRDLLANDVVYVNATAGVNGDNPTEGKRADFNNIEQVLDSADAMTILTSKEGADKFATGPTRDAYVGMCNSAIEPDLQNVEGVLLKANYPDKKDVKPEEYCSIGRFRLFTSSRGIREDNASLLGAHIYKIPLAGVESYCKLEQSKYSAKVGIIPDYAFSRIAQNYGMYAKFAIARALTNTNWISGLKVTKRL